MPQLKQQQHVNHVFYDALALPSGLQHVPVPSGEERVPSCITFVAGGVYGACLPCIGTPTSG